MADEAAETQCVTFTISDARVVNSKNLYALVDVEIDVAGIPFRILGVQIRHTGHGLAVFLPTQRDFRGVWKPVVDMPQELLEPLSNSVMDFLAEEGLVQRRQAKLFSQMLE